MDVPMSDLTELTIAEAAARIRARDLSPLELTEAYLRRIELLNTRLNAYVTVTSNRALDDARRATDEIAAGTIRGRLHGIPIALKDLFATAGILTTAGSKILAEWVPERDSTVARRLREAGAVLLGKTNTHEFARGGTTNNPHYGATHNPWKLDCIPGGSSGGSAAAMAAGLAAGTLGTDTAGSVRIPAAFCGVVGLKPTYGRVSKAGVVPLSWLYDNPGPITGTVEDAALMLGVIAGYDPDDFSTVPMPVDDYTARLREGIRGLRIGVPRDWFFDRLDDEVRAAVEAALAVLAELGGEVQNVSLPDMEALVRDRRVVTTTEFQQYHAPAFKERPHDFGADLRVSLEETPADGPAVMAALRTVYAATEAMRRTLTEVDVLVTPTTPIAAPRIGAETAHYGGGEESMLTALIRLTSPFNGAQLPALSVPCGFTAGGLPIGLQIAGRPFDEATVLRAGYAYEQATGWERRRPDLPLS
jgi:aspartyl-tRNA(Asn)/glutamyl-tRNA(Gln) amidotransferase subunit A